MTTTAADHALPSHGAPHEVPTGPLWLLRDSWTEATRHLRAIPRSPELLVFATIQPVMFVVLFVYVFGGAIQAPPEYTDYVQFLIPGIFAQTIVFNSSFTGVGLAEDLTKGIIDRLRSLPMNPAAVLVGRTISDAARNLVSFTVMLLVGFAVGFRFEGSAAGAIGGTLLMFAFSYAFCWIQALIGLSVGSVEAANSAGFLWMFPLTFISSAFVPTETMPSWLQPVADANPFTQLVNASRALYNGLDPGNAVVASVLWVVGITVVFGVLAIRKFNSSSAH